MRSLPLIEALRVTLPEVRLPGVDGFAEAVLRWNVSNVKDASVL